MGIGKKVVENKTKKVVENVTGDIPVVGDMVDKNVKSGPMDRAGDSVSQGQGQARQESGQAGWRRQEKEPVETGLKRLAARLTVARADVSRPAR